MASQFAFLLMAETRENSNELAVLKIVEPNRSSFINTIITIKTRITIYSFK